MQLSPLQQYCQEQILKRLYPDMILDEARGEEIQNNKCMFLLNSFGLVEYGYCHNVRNTDVGIVGSYGGVSFILAKENIIGLPPTLSRVLTALGDEYHYGVGFIYHISNIFSPDFVVSRDCKRQLLNENKTDATLFDQSEETQEAIGNLLGYKN